jgi:hypothetical protein
MKYLPLLLKDKASYYADNLKRTSDWTSMKTAFNNEFTVNSNIIIGELRTIRCTDFDVDAYTTKFHQAAARLDKSKGGVEA